MNPLDLNRPHPTSNVQKASIDQIMDIIAQDAPKDRTVIVHSPDGTTKDETQILRIRKVKVAWGIPTDEMIYSLWFSHYMRLQVMPWDLNIITRSTYLPDARNKVHNNFLNHKDYEWLVMLDSDVIPPPDFLDRLMAHGKKMVGGWYRRKNGAAEPVVYDFQNFDAKGVAWWNIRKVPGTGLEKVDGAGAGCWLIHRDVAEAIGENPYNMERGGEDLELCLKVKQAGFDMFIDWSINCAHAGVAFV